MFAGLDNKIAVAVLVLQYVLGNIQARAGGAPWFIKGGRLYTVPIENV